MNNTRTPPRNPLLLIPARMAASRLPGKPLAMIGDAPMIVQVMRRAAESRLGRVVVAAGDAEIVEAVKAAGGEAVLTDANLPTGSDRIHAALRMLDPEGQHDAIVNVQGDVPTLDGKYIRAACDVLQNPDVDIATLATRITDDADRFAPQVVKAALELKEGATTGRALYFSRLPVPSGEGPHYAHIGIYAYRRAALEAFVAAPRGVLEARESLEQLRALTLNLRIDAALVDAMPLGVDTPEDLAKAREIMKKMNA
jgi:3-deoxy-manno-octulosonate cytidylyltransferase (CMP-KDO synthetase)